jgi:hypothetical protein
MREDSGVESARGTPARHGELGRAGQMTVDQRPDAALENARA